MPSPTSRQVHLADDRWIHLLQWDGKGPVCVLLHGCGDCAWVWRSIAETLSRHCTVLALDLPGHGESSWLGDSAHSAADAATVVAEALSQLGVDHFFLMGHSLGGEVAINLAARSPAQLFRLVLADCDPEVASLGALEVLKELRDMPRRFSAVAAFGDYLVARHPLAEPQDLYQLAEASLKQANDGCFELSFDLRWLDAFEAEIKGGQATDHLWRLMAQISCPTLVLRGAGSSVLTAAAAKRMAYDTLPCGALEVVPIAGHNLMLDNPARMSEIVIKFLAHRTRGAFSD